MKNPLQKTKKMWKQTIRDVVEISNQLKEMSEGAGSETLTFLIITFIKDGEVGHFSTMLNYSGEVFYRRIMYNFAMKNYHILSISKATAMKDINVTAYSCLDEGFNYFSFIQGGDTVQDLTKDWSPIRQAKKDGVIETTLEDLLMEYTKVKAFAKKSVDK